ncbi:helix-turn-helix domain-containing protein [Tenacibaculum ovolyticum]|uniref:helix-turn-helix domain-containing protein n=1 Tax=Tenacibaculum ovolyticum TaxID=104270 RepID=UPI003BABE48C
MNNPFKTIDERLSNIEDLLLDIKHTPQQKDEPQQNNLWFDLNDLVKYDPEKRTKPTFYGYVHQGSIPYHKRGKKLIFLKSEIDEWLKSGRVKTNSEIKKMADNYISSKKD